MPAQHGRLGAVLVLPLFVGLALVCFARLVAEPGALIIDGRRPSVDETQRAEPRATGNDLTRLFLPHHLRIAGQVARRGRFSLWDPFGFGGRPRVGNPQAGLWYPPVWLAWWSGAPSALGWLTVGHLIWAACGVYVLARALGIGRWGAVVAAGCFEMAPFVLAQAFEGHYPHVWAACWYPWAFWASALLRRGEWGGMLALPPILALALLTGHPQEWYYMVFVLGSWALADVLAALVCRGRGGARPGMGHEAGPAELGPGPSTEPPIAGPEHRPRAAWLRPAAWAAALAWALGLAAVELAPDLDAGAWALRSGRMSLKHASHYHIYPLNFLQLISPRALGGPADFCGHDNHWETMLSIGWVPLVLAALAAWRSPRRGPVRAWAVLTAAAVVFAAGRRLGLFALLYAILPGMDQFRVPTRSLFLASLGAAILAGLGIDALAEPSRRALAGWRGAERRYRRWLTLIGCGLLAGQALAWRPPRPAEAPRARSDELGRWVRASTRLAHDPIFWTVLAGTTLGIAWAHRRPGDGHRISWALGALALFELGAHGLGLLRTAPAEQFLGPDPVSAALERARPAGPFRIRARDAFYDDLRAARHGLEKTNINDLFQVQHAADLYECLYTLFRPPSPPPADAQQPTLARRRRRASQGVLDRMNVALMVTDHPEPGAPWPVAASGTWAGARFFVYRNPTALPRAYVVPRAHVVPAGASALALFPAVDPRQAVLMRADPLGPSGPDRPRQPFTPATYDAADPDRIVIRVATRAPGLLVVADTWMPGWSARVDGRPAPLLRGNHAQRVIPLPRPGRHVVVLRYEPPGLRAGLRVTAIAGLAWIVALGTWIARRAVRHHPVDRTSGAAHIAAKICLRTPASRSAVEVSGARCRVRMKRPRWSATRP